MPVLDLSFDQINILEMRVVFAFLDSSHGTVSMRAWEWSEEIDMGTVVFLPTTFVAVFVNNQVCSCTNK